MNLPNKITLSRICLIPVFVIVYLVNFPYHFLAAGLVFVLAACTDFIDGHIARSRNLVTDLGKFLDPIADKVLVSTALIMLLVNPKPLSVLWPLDWVMIAVGICVAVILARELIVSGFRMVAASKGIVLAADKVGKIKTVFQDFSIAILMLSADFIHLTLFSEVLNGIGLVSLGIATILTIWSGLGYVLNNKAVLVTENRDKQ